LKYKPIANKSNHNPAAAQTSADKRQSRKLPSLFANVLSLTSLRVIGPGANIGLNTGEARLDDWRL
jgi:hypothetical protein